MPFIRCELSTWHEASVIPYSELLKNVVGKDAIFCNLTDKIDAAIIEAAGPSLKVIATMSVGYENGSIRMCSFDLKPFCLLYIFVRYEHIDLNECKKRGIRVGYTPDVLTDATADLTMALLLATSRRLIEGNHEVHNGGWKSWSPLYMCGPSIKNSTVGIVGFGRIAQEVAKRLIPFKPGRIVYSNRSDSREKEAKALGVERVTFEQLLNISDFVILLCSLAPETTHLMNAKTLAQMKSTAILINCARGPCVEQNDLYDALSKNVIRAAGLDVTTPEPLPLNSPLLTLNNCVVVPHIGSAEIETRCEMARITVGNILGGLNNSAMVSEL